jgi:CheY-like chemotaxis protein
MASLPDSSKILIADDYSAIRELVSSFLRSMGYDVLEAKNGAQAIQTAVAAVPKFILLDIKLPDMSGMDVARALRALPHTADIPIVGWTIDIASKPPRNVLLSAGLTDCLEKPASLSVLEALVVRFVPKPQPFNRSPQV